MRKLTKDEVKALDQLSEAEKTFMECIDIIADTIGDNKNSFYFAALSSICHFLIMRLQEDEMHALGDVYVHLMKLKKEGFNNERFN